MWSTYWIRPVCAERGSLMIIRGDTQIGYLRARLQHPSEFASRAESAVGSLLCLRPRALLSRNVTRLII